MNKAFNSNISKILTFSFDDGNLDDVRLIEILNKYGLKGTFNLNSGSLTECSKWMYNGEKEVRHINYYEHSELYNGHEIACHTYTHPHLEQLDGKTVYNEIALDKALLSHLFHCEIHGMAYPFGTFNDNVVRIVDKCGLVYSRAVYSTYDFSLPDNLLIWNPTCHFKNPKINVAIFTHNHLDHYDPETAKKFITADSNITVLAPKSVWDEVRKIGGNNNYVLFNRHTQWTQNGIMFAAVKAEHSDPTPIGVLIDDGKRKYYVTGDTLYNEEIFGDIPNDIYAVFLPANGVGNNMNMTDAARFAKRVNAVKTVPIHIGMFDELKADDFDCPNKVIPEIYKEIKL